MGINDDLLKDPRLHALKKEALKILAEHQSKITGIKDADPTLKARYEEILKKMYDLRGGKLYYPYIGSGIGKGSLVELYDGSIKYDMITGIGPHVFGHSNHDIVEALIDASFSDTVMQGHLQQNIDSVELIELLTQVSNLPHCFLSSTGVMANENAIKIAFQKKFPANRILAFERCFVGRTIAVSQITDKPGFREGLPPTLQVDYIPYYKNENSIDDTLMALRKVFKRYPKQHAIMILELVQGEGGFYTAPPSFFKALCEELKKEGIPIFADEVQTFGRTHRLFAFQYYGLDSYVDIASIGKLSQVCATLFTDEMKPRAGLLSQTFTAATSAIRASKVIIKKLQNEGYFGENGKNAYWHELFVKGFEAINKRHPGLIEGPYGIGGMIAFTPLKGNNEKVTKLVQTLFEKGVITFTAGSDPTRVRLLIPLLAITEEDIKNVLKIIEEALLCHL